MSRCLLYKQLLTLAVPLALLLAGCEKDIAVYPTPATASVIFDPNPASPHLPTPTDLARDPSTGLLKVPVSAEPAQGAFDAYLNTLNGYPTSAAGEVCFTGAVDPATVTKETLPVLETSGATTTPVTGLVYQVVTGTEVAAKCSPVLLDDKGQPVIDDATKQPKLQYPNASVVRIWNYAGWKRGTTYLAYVVGGDSGVKVKGKDADGKDITVPVIPSTKFALASTRCAICAWDSTRSWDDASNGCNPAPTGTKATGCCTFNYSSLVEAQVKKDPALLTKIATLSFEDAQLATKAAVLKTATDLERVRQSLHSYFVMAGRDVDCPKPDTLVSDDAEKKKDETAVLWSFTTVSDTEAVFDPAQSPPQVPTPNDLAKDPTTGLLTIPTATTASAAEKAFSTSYLSTLDGYPTTTTSAALAWTGDLDPATVAGGMKVYELGASSLTPVTDATVTYDATGKRVIVSRAAGFSKRGATYVVIATDGASGVKTKDGKTVHRSALMQLALSPAPLCTLDASKKCTDVKVSSFIDDPADKPGAMTGLAKATRFVAIRAGYAPLLALVEAAGVKKDEVVSLWTFSIVSMTEVLYNPTTGAIPFPNNLLLDPAGLAKNPPEYKVALPEQPNETASQKALRQGLNTLDGFTTQGAYLAATSGVVDKTSVEATTAVALNLATGKPVAMSFQWSDTAGAFIARPQLPLEEKTQYGIVLISRLKAGDAKPDGKGLKDDKGRRVVPASFMALIRSADPLVEGGKSTVSVLDDKTAQQAEQVRVTLKPFFDALEANTALGIRRADIVAAWTFRTQTITEPLTKLRALPWNLFGTLDSNQPKWTGSFDPTLTGFPAQAPKDALGGWVPNGAFTSWNALDEAGSGAFLTDPTTGKAAQIPFMMTVPKSAMPTAGYPLVVYQHGITRAKTDFLAVANTLAKAGLATIAFDTPYHGTRSWCTKDAECASSGTCDAKTGACSTSLALDPQTGIPLASGARFLNVSNPFAIRDNMRQYVIDASALLRGVGVAGLGAPLAAANLTNWTTAGLTLDHTKVYFVGQSLGSILGTLILSVDSLPSRGVLNVPGAPVVDVILSSQSFADVKAGVLKQLSITEGSYDYYRILETIFNWVLDPADPGNFARYVKTAQLPDLVKSKLTGKAELVTAKEVIIQLAEQDKTIPIARGQYLAAAMGVDTTNTVYAGQGHGFLLTPTPDLAATGAAQSQMDFFLVSNATDKTVCKPNLTAGTCP